MKTILKTIAASFLGFLASSIVRKYRPLIVMVTGSVGKTSTKDAVAAALADSYFLRASEKSYNSEFGVPLTIIGAKNPWSNPLAWIRVIEEALALIFLPSHYPKVLVLEVGADRPGDLKKILRIVTPDAVVVTHLPHVPVHVEAYATPQAVRDEEFAPAYALPQDAPLVFSADDGYAAEMAARLPVRRISFGYDTKAQVRITDPELLIEAGNTMGMKARVAVSGAHHALVERGALGRSQLYAPAAALALAVSLGMDAKEALAGLGAYTPPPGRGRLFSGANGVLLIDDSYNASPAAVEESLAALALVTDCGRHVAILGDMLELGRYSVEEHERIGKLAAQSVDALIAVGIRAHAIASAARAHGMPETVVHAFDTSEDAVRELPKLLEPKDAVLVKGSQAIRMERIVESLLKNPEDRAKLVRQDKEWLLKK
ncbi:MAG: UDP-N-acetylmuramoyl-tripeptide--D-alanyl-D-alanine ligase [Parcubacteria bacterium C7867-001]|nr:MAG: UDP-N-acetylmuramoyl-tripeptide--D-alanyl-D-alanine ligase [Parcubacteria bacterium C7867-001]